MPSSPSPTDTKQRHDDMQRVLATWRAQQLIREDWTLEWDADAGQWRTTFFMAGCPQKRNMVESEFALYYMGFTDRPRAIRHRPPLITRIPGQTLPGSRRKKSNRV